MCDSLKPLGAVAVISLHFHSISCVIQNTLLISFTVQISHRRLDRVHNSSKISVRLTSQQLMCIFRERGISWVDASGHHGHGTCYHSCYLSITFPLQVKTPQLVTPNPQKNQVFSIRWVYTMYAVRNIPFTCIDFTFYIMFRLTLCPWSWTFTV